MYCCYGNILLRDSVVVVMCMRPQAILLAMITMRKFIDGFPFLSHMSKGLRLAFGPPELCYKVGNALR